MITKPYQDTIIDRYISDAGFRVALLGEIKTAFKNIDSDGDTTTAEILLDIVIEAEMQMFFRSTQF